MRILALFALLAIAACDTDDATFMLVCEDVNGFHYPIDNAVASPDCADPQEITWAALPLRVDVAGLDSDYQESLTEAMSFWNDELDMTAFVRDDADPQVSVVIGSASDPGVGAAFHVRNLDGSLGAIVELRKPGSTTEALYVFDHELGHVLGLAHDPGSSSSAMYPELDYGWDDPDQDFRFIVVTSNDRDAIRAKYR